MSRPRFLRAMIPIQALALAACAALVPGAGASSAALLTPAGPAAFTDPSGDAQGGPDVTNVTVSGEASTGSITITVTAAGYIPDSPDVHQRAVVVWLDTDVNRSTGDPEDGTEYALQAWNDPSGRWWNVLRWSGTAWELASRSPSMSFSRHGDTLSWTVGMIDIGGATRFRFYVLAGTWNAAANRFDARDEAPDDGWWSYDVSAATPPPQPLSVKTGLIVGAPDATPPVAVAGKRFAVQFRVQIEKEAPTTVVDLATGTTRQVIAVTWTPVRDGRMSCVAAIAGRALPARCGPLASGLAKLSLVVPQTARGKRLRISVKITAKDPETGTTLTRTRVATFAVK